MNIFNSLKEIISYRELLFNIAIREIKVRYKQSVLGIVWAIIQPFATMIVFTVIFSVFMKVPSEGLPYPIFSYTALLPWTLFATSLSFAIPSLVGNANIVTKLYFPREIFPIASVLAAFVDFFIASIIFAGMLIFYKVSININVLFLIPILLIQVMFTIGIALFASALNVYYRDIKYGLPLVISLWMYACPIIYPVSLVPEKYINFYMLNPMAPIMDGYRKVLLHGIHPDFYYLSIAAFVSLATLILSYRFFKRVEMNFADII